MNDTSNTIEYKLNGKSSDVFDAWSDKTLIDQWWGPEGFHTKVLELDFVVGGRFVFEMTAPSGSQCHMTGIYRRIQRPKLLEFDLIDHCNLDLPDAVVEQESKSYVVIEFVDNGNQTIIRLTHSALHPTYLTLALVGWRQTIEGFDRTSAATYRLS